MRDLLVLEFVNTINEGLCERHSNRCPAASSNIQFQQECGHVVALAESIRQELLSAGQSAPPDSSSLCRNKDRRCHSWAAAGNCESNAGVTLHCFVLMICGNAQHISLSETHGAETNLESWQQSAVTFATQSLADIAVCLRVCRFHGC